MQQNSGDERELEYRLDTMDTFQLAENAARVVPQLMRIAIFTNPSTMDDAFFFETVAVNRGLSVKVFPSLKEARGWLQERQSV